jgi:hypothetical protein
VTAQNLAIRAGQFYELNHLPGFSHKHYAYLRFTPQHRVLVVANFDRYHPLVATVHLPEELLGALQLDGGKPLNLKNLLSGESFRTPALREGIPLRLAPTDACILSF